MVEIENKNITIMKVGGSCLTKAESLEHLLEIIELYKSQTIIFVASAFSGVTDMLLDTASLAANKDDSFKEKLQEVKQLHQDINKTLFADQLIHYESTSDFINTCIRSLEEILEQICDYGLETFRSDYVVSFGEKFSTFVMAEFLASKGLDGFYLPADQLIVTDDRFGNALPLMDFTKRKIKRQLIPIINRGSMPCITGFIGLNKQGFVTTLGRGGTDFTATIVACCLSRIIQDANIKVILWKNVDGILSASPEFVDTPRLLEKLTYGEAKEISHFGAKVLHPKCITPIEKEHIPLEIRNFDKNIENKFTLIDKVGDDSIMLKGFSILKDVALITARSSSLVAVPGVLAKIFTILGEKGINVSFVSQSSSEINTTFCTAEKDGNKAVDLLQGAFTEWFDFSCNEDIVVLGVIGAVNKPSVKDQIFKTCDDNDIEVLAIAQSADSLNISIVINEGVAHKAIKAIHDCFDSCFA